MTLGPAHEINRESYMSAHVLLNLLNELGKRDKMWGLPSILSLIRSKFNKFNKSGAQILDSVYHMICGMRFPTMWYFDKCRLRQACAASF